MNLFFWIVDLIIPVVMVIIGMVFSNRPPRKINEISGYRTRNSMLSENTWIYANKRCGILYFKEGFILLLVIIISKLFIPIPKEYLSIIHVLLGVIALVIPIPFVENELRTKFDSLGNKK